MMRRTTLLLLLIAGGLSLTLFAVKYEVQDLEQELIGLNRGIIADRQAIHVLQAEWSHLNNPERLRELASRHLGMTEIDPAQLSTLAGLPMASAISGAKFVAGSDTASNPNWSVAGVTQNRPSPTSPIRENPNDGRE